VAGTILEQPRAIRLAFEAGSLHLHILPFLEKCEVTKCTLVFIYLSIELFVWVCVCGFWGYHLSRLCLQFAGEYIKTWRRRWFVLKEGHIFWFKENYVSQVKDPIASKPLRNLGCSSFLQQQFYMALL
jgi:hypothetical protein